MVVQPLPSKDERRSADLIEIYRRLLRKLHSKVNGDPTRLRRMADEWSAASRSVANSIEQVEKALKDSNTWEAPSAYPYRFRTNRVITHLDATGIQFDAIGAPLRAIATQQEIASSRIAELIREFDYRVDVINYVTIPATQGLSTRDLEVLRRNKIAEAGSSAADAARAVIQQYRDFVGNQQSELADVIHLKPSWIRQLAQPTPKGAATFAGFVRGDFGVSPSDLMYATIYGIMGFFREAARKAVIDGIVKASAYGAGATGPSIGRNIVMLYAGGHFMENPLTQTTYAFLSNAAGVYGTNRSFRAITKFLGREMGSDAERMLLANNTVASSLLYWHRRGLAARGDMAITEEGRIDPLSNDRYYDNALGQLLAIGGTSAISTSIDTLYRSKKMRDLLAQPSITSTGFDSPAFSSNDIIQGLLHGGSNPLAQPTGWFTRKGLKAAGVAAATNFTLATATTLINGTMDLPPEPNLQYKALNEVGYARQDLAHWLGHSPVGQHLKGIAVDGSAPIREAVAETGELVASGLDLGWMAYNTATSGLWSPLLGTGGDVAGSVAAGGEGATAALNGAAHYNGSLLTQGVSPTEQQEYREAWERLGRSWEKFRVNAGDLMKYSGAVVP